MCNNIFNIIKNQLNSEGSAVGYWEFYYSNGNLNSKGNYINGKAYGYWEYYYIIGKLAYKGNYVNGEKDGYWEKYHSDGELESMLYYY